MFNAVEYVRGVCRQRNIPIAQLEKDCGFANGYLNPKKLSKIPYERAKKIADYLNLSLEYIMNGADTKEKEETSVLTEKDRRDIARDIEKIMNALDTAGDLQFDGDPISDEARESIKAAMKLGLEAAKVKNKQRFTPKKYRKE